jgi:hypothetical protein
MLAGVAFSLPCNMSAGASAFSKELSISLTSGEYDFFFFPVEDDFFFANIVEVTLSIPSDCGQNELNRGTSLDRFEEPETTLFNETKLAGSRKANDSTMLTKTRTHNKTEVIFPAGGIFSTEIFQPVTKSTTWRSQSSNSSRATVNPARKEVCCLNTLQFMIQNRNLQNQPPKIFCRL